MLSHPGIATHSIQEHVEGKQVTDNLSYQMLPGMMALQLHMLAMALTADLLVTEKEGGLITRDFVCGIPLVFVLLAQLVVLLIVILGQIGFSLILLAVVFPNLPSQIFFFMLFLLLSQSLCGMNLGFFLTALLKTRNNVINAGMGFVFPSFILSGILWPRITMPYVLQVISVMLPLTITCDVAKDSVLNRTTAVNHVYLGFLIPLGWTLIFFLCCLLVIRKWGFRI